MVAGHARCGIQTNKGQDTLEDLTTNGTRGSLKNIDSNTVGVAHEGERLMAVCLGSETQLDEAVYMRGAQVLYSWSGTGNAEAGDEWIDVSSCNIIIQKIDDIKANTAA